MPAGLSIGVEVAVDPKTWWYVSRATGFVSWALLALAVLWGLFLSTRSLGKAALPAWLLDLHRHLGGLAVVFVGVHMLGLALDGYVSFGWSDLLVPMASTWKPGPVAWGVVALYLLLAVEVTALLQRRLPRRLWREVHMLSFPLYVIATIHLFAAGTDAGNAIVAWTVVIVSTLVVFLTLVRVLAAKAQARTRAAATPAVAAVPVAAAVANEAAETEDDPRARRAAMLARARAEAAARAG